MHFRYNKYPLWENDALVVNIWVNVPENINIKLYDIPFSYKAENKQAALICDSLVFGSPVGFKSAFYWDGDIDPENEMFFVSRGTLNSFTFALEAGHSRLLCKAYFTISSDGAPNDIQPASTAHGRHPVLYLDYYRGVNGISKLLPMISSTVPGDANCDGKISVSDVIWMVNYLLNGGPAPGDCYE